MILGYHDVHRLVTHTLGRWIPAEQFETRVLITDDAFRTTTWNFIRGIVRLVYI